MYLISEGMLREMFFNQSWSKDTPQEVIENEYADFIKKFKNSWVNFDILINYLKSHTAKDIEEKYLWHRDLVDYEPYWLELKTELQQAIKVLEREGSK